MQNISKICFSTFLFILLIDVSYASFRGILSQAHTYVSLGQTNHAIALYDQLLLHSPYNTHLLYNKAYSLKMAGKVDEAISLYKTILQLDADHEKARFGLAMSYLYCGNFHAAWPYYDAYIQKTYPHAFKLRKALRENSIQGKKVVLHYQGGLGDSLHFIRYVQVLKEMGAYTIVSIQKPLALLLSRCSYIDKLITSGDSLPAHDIRASLMALPALFESTEETLPRAVPYIFPDESLVAYWKTLLSQDNSFRIGICWQADLHNDSSRYPVAHRSIPLSLFYSITQLDNVQLYSLQKLDTLEDIKKVTDILPIKIFPALDTDHGAFMDTAALMQSLDLVISVDTALAHLAGALGIPTYLLLPYTTDWRWIIQRTDSPWYPSMTIFKQQNPFEWEPVVDQVIKKIHSLLNEEL